MGTEGQIDDRYATLLGRLVIASSELEEAVGFHLRNLVADDDLFAVFCSELFVTQRCEKIELLSTRVIADSVVAAAFRSWTAQVKTVMRERNDIIHAWFPEWHRVVDEQGERLTMVNRAKKRRGAMLRTWHAHQLQAVIDKVTEVAQEATRLEGLLNDQWLLADMRNRSGQRLDR